MDMVCPLGRGSSWDNEELRYTLRSIEQNIPGLDKLYIIGNDIPQWLDCRRVPCPDASKYPDVNIFRKIIEACSQSDLSEDFLFINDDHFLLSRVESRFPYFFKNTLQEELESPYRRNSPYKQVISNTIKALNEKIGHAAHLNYDLHCPIIYRKSLIQVLETFDWSVPAGYCIKSLYGAIAGLHSQSFQTSDFKVDGPMSYEQLDSIRRSRLFFSTGGDVHPITQQFLVETFPIKSRWEL